MSQKILLLLVFVAGMAVMAVEMTATRLLAPFFGASLFVWTSVIAVVMGALAAGYEVGGRMADGMPRERLTAAILRAVFGAGALTLLIPSAVPYVVAAVGPLTHGRGVLSVLIPSLLTSFLLFAGPIFLMAMITPLAARVHVTDMGNVGRPLGNLFFVSTAGSLFGVFLPVLVTVPLIGSRATFFVFGGLLAAIGVFRGRRRWLVLAAVLAVVLFVEWKRSPDPSVLWEKESVYQLVRVRRTFDGARLMEVNEGKGMQSYFKTGEDLTGYYWDTALIPPVLYPGGRRYLFLGVGGGTAPRLVGRHFPDMEITGIEIDPVMLEAGRRHFEMDAIGMRTVVEDARVFLNGSPQKSKDVYDFIMVDVYRDNRSIPFHLATREFFELVRDRMAPRGVLLMNVACSEGGERLFDVIGATVGAVFPYTGYLKVRGGACEIFASQEPLAMLTDVLEPLRRTEAVISRDDRTNVEILSAVSAR